LKIKEFLLNILLEKELKWMMKIKEDRNFTHKKSLLKIILFNKFQIKNKDNEKS